jgi:cell wall-associated NlpC family hydrolase
MRTRLILFLTTATVFGLVLVVPYRTSLVRLGLLGLWVLLAVSLLLLVWRRKVWRTLLLIALALLGLFAVLPGRGTTDTARLRQRFVQYLQSYDGVRYIYGGENRLGIDCSGLVRAAMFRALIDEAICAADPALLRAALTLWWRDTNAIQLGKGGKGLTLSIGDGLPLPMRAAPNLRRGDLAVTTSGSHVLAYLDGSRWIEADPDVARVHIVDLKTSPIAEQEVLLVTWFWLR